MGLRAMLAEARANQWSAWRQTRAGAGGEGAESHFAGPLLVLPGHGFVDIDLEIDVSWQGSRAYRYSKLYFSRSPAHEFAESRVVCFRIGENRRRHRVRIELPGAARGAGLLFLRLDPFPYARGTARVHGFWLVAARDRDAKLSRAARLDALKERTRAAVEKSEREQVQVADHYPESLGLELQPGCNLVCGHCSSHGTEALHARHNRMGAIEGARLAQLADEVFPHLTMVNVVGRGEPLMVSDALWAEFAGHLARNRVMLSVVTNGYFIERRITPELLPWIDTLTVSIDGLAPETFAENRGGASFDKVIAGVRHFHELRKAAGLPRRPKLCISWTLKKNNIREFPDFVRFMAQFEPDRFYARHLLLFHDKDAGESLLDSPDLANRYLSQAYELMAEHGIETDCPPLFESVDAFPRPGDTPKESPAATGDMPPELADVPRQDLACVYIHRTGILLAGGEMSTCGVQYAAKVGDFGDASFMDLWNGEVMRNVRRDINTPAEWDQCRDCWFRQSRFHEQRSQRAQVAAYPLKRMTRFSRKAWDFRGYEEMTKK
jgi:MoaA/NifB/PqqE/SkfB family radical SAM enzyme